MVSSQIFSKTKFSTKWALEAKSEFNLELYRHQRLFWIIAQLCMFWTRKSVSSTLRGCRGALHEVGDSAIIGKDFSITILTKNEPKLEKLVGWLGNFSCLVLAWHVKYIWIWREVWIYKKKKNVVCLLNVKSTTVTFAYPPKCAVTWEYLLLPSKNANSPGKKSYSFCQGRRRS